jgi:hypothetical protein
MVMKGEARREKIAYVIPRVGKGVRQRKGGVGVGVGQQKRDGDMRKGVQGRGNSKRCKGIARGTRDEVVKVKNIMGRKREKRLSEI